MKTSLKQSFETKWNSNHCTLDSIIQQHEISTQYDKTAQINDNSLKTAVGLFKEATNDFESENSSPSASLELPCFLQPALSEDTSARAPDLLPDSQNAIAADVVPRCKR